MNFPPDQVTSTKGIDMATAIQEETIRNRAFELFLERGSEHGNDREDWFRAESELLKQTGKNNTRRSSTEKKVIKSRK